MAVFVLVHGICHGAWCWDGVRRTLTGRGHRVVAVDLPLTSLEADAAQVREALDQLDEPAIVVGHSYGGLVMSRAVQDHHDVRHLVYVAAIMIDGTDVFTARMADFPSPPLHERIERSGDGQLMVSAETAVACFYNRCDEREARRHAERLRPTAAVCLRVPSGGEPWRSTPSTYVVCTEDRAIDPAYQRWMARRADDVVTFDTDHSPFLSSQPRFVELLDEVATRVAGRPV
jgi:pimeloyl-ACP methyl ester carboxylesterase